MQAHNKISLNNNKTADKRYQNFLFKIVINRLVLNETLF